MAFPHLFRTEHSVTKTTNCVYGSFFETTKKVPISEELLDILRYGDLNREIFLKNLEDVTKIKSISNDSDYLNDLNQMIKYTENWLIKLGLDYECFHHRNREGKELPPIFLASLGNQRSKKKKTVCIYAHLDVRKPNTTQWETDPWVLTKNNNKLYGNGVCNGKSILLCWFHIIEAFQNSGIEFPVNLKFVIECMFHHRSEGLENFLTVHRDKFFRDINNIVVCDSEWMRNKQPSIVHGTVGHLHFNLFIEKIENSQSQVEDDMRNILKEIVDENENILIPNFNDFVLPITPIEEKAIGNVVDFDINEIRESLPQFKKTWSQLRLLMHYWRLPSIWLGEIEKCTCPDKKVIMSKIKTQIIIKIVPRQIVDKSINLFTKHINKLAKDLDIKNKVFIELVHATRPWLEDSNSKTYLAAKRAIRQIYKVEANLIREDGSRLLITILETVLQKPILLLPFATKSSNIGAENENISIKNWIEGSKVLAAYLFQIAQLNK